MSRSTIQRPKEPWFPPSPDRELLAALLTILSSAMGLNGFPGWTDVVKDYLDGKSVVARIGLHGVRHFDAMSRTLGMKPPEPS